MLQESGVSEIRPDWCAIRQHCRKIADWARPQGFNRLCAVTRGGLVPSAFIAHYLDIKIIDTVGVESFNRGNEHHTALVLKFASAGSYTKGKMLIVDDICDTGVTLERMHRMFPAAGIAAVYSRKGCKVSCPHFFSAEEITSDAWVHFPWELDGT